MMYDLWLTLVTVGLWPALERYLEWSETGPKPAWLYYTMPIKESRTDTYSKLLFHSSRKLHQCYKLATRIESHFFSTSFLFWNSSLVTLPPPQHFIVFYWGLSDFRVKEHNILILATRPQKTITAATTPVVLKNSPEAGLQSAAAPATVHQF